MTGSELRRYRKERLGLSLERLGERLDIPWNTIARWERGEIKIQHPVVLQFALERVQEVLVDEALASIRSCNGGGS